MANSKDPDEIGEISSGPVLTAKVKTIFRDRTTLKIYHMTSPLGVK